VAPPGVRATESKEGQGMSSNRWWKRWAVVSGWTRPSAAVLPVGLVLLLVTLPLAGAGRPAGAPQPPATAQPPDQTQPAPDPAEADAQEPPEAEQPVFRTEINYVRVDAIITDDDDNLVLDLTQDDFEIFEDDIPQQIENFELIELDGDFDPSLPPPSSIRNDYDQDREAARPDSRVFVFFLDDYHVRDYNAVRMTAPLVEFVQTQLGPSDLVGIMYPLTPLFDVQLTRDHDQVVHALERFVGRKWEYDPINTYESQYAYYPTEVVEKIRNDVSLSALKALAIHLGGLREGRKSVIVLSEGYTDYVPPQHRDESAEGGGQRSFQRSDPFAGESRMEQTSAFFEYSSMRADLVYAADLANRNNTSFYTVDPRGLAVFEYDMSMVGVSYDTDQAMLRNLQDTLYVLAEESDGRAIINRNDVMPGLQQIVRDSSAYYLLGYTSSERPTDGKFHEIEVKVKREDVKVRARKGYYALTEANAARVLTPPKPPVSTEIDRALSTLAEPARGRLVRTWVGTSRAENGRTKVTFVWEPVGESVSRTQESASQVMLMAMSDTDAYFRGELRSERDPRAEFEAPPGALELNAAIEDEFGDVIDRRVEELLIPDFTGVDVALSTPAVFRAANAPQFRQIVADADALPTATRFFRRTDQLLVRFEVYTPGNVAVPSAQLLSREGTPIVPLTVEQAPDGGHQLAVALASFPRGDYIIEISVAVGEERVTELVAFRMQG
jgi:VWFA-related protein